MTDVEAGTTKDGKVITTGYGAAPASVEAIPGNTPEKKTQSWATSAAYIFGFLVLVIGGMQVTEGTSFLQISQGSLLLVFVLPGTVGVSYYFFL